MKPPEQRVIAFLDILGFSSLIKQVEEQTSARNQFEGLIR